MNTNLKMLRINKSNTEEALIRECRNGLASAQRSLYERYAPKMLGVCMRYIHDFSEAEHVMVGGMVKVFERLAQFKGDGSFEGWIRRIMVNESLMFIRKNKNMSLEVDIESNNEGYDVDLTVIEDGLEAKDLLAMIAKLPIGYRTVFNLYAIEGFSHREVAEQLGISENTSKSQLSRARNLLQDQLQKLQKQELKKDKSNG